MQARLPEHMARVTIKDMIIGEEAYTVPWSLQVDQHGRCWIRGDYSFSYRPLGTNRLAIRRTFNGFEVQVSPGEQYEQVYITPEAQLRMNLLPVTNIR